MSWIWLCRLNDQGDTLWNRFYNYYGGLYDEIPYDMKLTPDGGVVVTGYILTSVIPTNNDAFVLKVDSMGCEIPGCHVSVSEIVAGVQIKLYPNPTSGQITIDTELGKINNGTVEIYDITGKLVAEYELSKVTSTTKIGLDQLSGGIYTYAVLENGMRVSAGKFNLMR